MASYDQKIRKKSNHFSSHGKHAKIDPALIRNEKKRRRTKMYDSVRDLFRENR